jgi:RNA polymerase sigma factor (sigma-70 family)
LAAILGDGRGMTETPETNREGSDPRRGGACMNAPELEAWFVREVLPLEAMLMHYLRHHWRNAGEIADLRQEVYMRVCEAAHREIPHPPAKPFVFAIARNLLIDRIRRQQIVPIDAVSDIDALNIALDQPGPDRQVIARDQLRKVQAAMDRLPPRCREAVWLKKVDGLSVREIATRMGISENTVDRHLTDGARALADMLYGEAP